MKKFVLKFHDYNVERARKRVYIVERSLHENFIRHELCIVVRAIEFVLKLHVYIFEKVESLHTSLNFKRNVQSNEFIVTRSRDLIILIQVDLNFFKLTQIFSN